MDRQRRSITLAGIVLTLGLAGVSHAQVVPPPGEEPGVTRLVLDTNAACELRVGGMPQPPVLLQGQPRTLIVAPGELAIECTSTTVAAATLKVVKAVAAGTRQSVALDLAELVVKASCAGKPATLADLGNGILRHCVSLTDWTQTDSGAGGMPWEAARAWCAKKGDGWELPAADELAELIDRSGRSQSPCGKFTCNVSPRFHLTSPVFWTREVTGPGMVMQVNLMLGGRHPTGQDDNFDYRGLCVRHSAR
jgi:hypothetical protein